VWTDADIAQFNKVASEPLRAALVLGLWTGQRQGDLLRLRWTAYNGRFIEVRQPKTKARVIIPTAAALRATLRALRRRRKAATILTNSRGLPWTSSGFRASWRKACAAAGIAELRFNDLRGSAVTRLAEAGATEPEIAAITGHRLGYVTQVMDRYLNRSKALAQNAIAKLEKNIRPAKR
jgi:integrase